MKVYNEAESSYKERLIFGQITVLSKNIIFNNYLNVVREKEYRSEAMAIGCLLDISKFGCLNLSFR